MSYCVTGVFLVYLVHPPCLKLVVSTEPFTLLGSLLDKWKLIEIVAANVLHSPNETRGM